MANIHPSLAISLAIILLAVANANQKRSQAKENEQFPIAKIQVDQSHER